MLTFGKITMPDSTLNPEAMPSGETQVGKVWQFVPDGVGGGSMQLRHPKLAFGPSAITSNINIGTSWTDMWSGTLDANGFYTWGLVSYVPRGTWAILCGKVVIASSATSMTITARVMQGTAESDPTNQPNIAIGSPVQVGAGQQVSMQTANIPFTLVYTAARITCATAPNHATQVWVQMKASSSGATALAANGDGASPFLSDHNIVRLDGYGV